MKIILIPLVWIMLPFAFIVVAFEVAKAVVADKVASKLEKDAE
jgi:hypothetical protein